MKADVTGKPIIVPSSDTATTWGAAMLAGVGVGVYKGFDEAVQQTVQVKREHAVNWEEHEGYTDSYETYLALYQALRPVMHRGGQKAER